MGRVSREMVLYSIQMDKKVVCRDPLGNTKEFDASELTFRPSVILSVVSPLSRKQENYDANGSF